MPRITVLVLALFVAACSWQQGYLSAQGWQRNECARLPDPIERDRCLGRAAMSYDEYRRQTDGTKTP